VTTLGIIDRYPHQRRLFAIAVMLSALFWVSLALFLRAAADHYSLTVGFDYVAASLVILIILAYLALLLRKARLVAYLRGNAVEIGPNQHPDLHARLKAVCKRLQVDATPDMYLFQNPEIPDCFSVRFRGQSFLALNGEVVGALTERQGAIDFVMGHEIGRINDRHARWIPFIFPTMVLPLLGPAYARAKVYSYDRYGIAACKAKVDAAFALAVVASGSRRWKSFNISQFASQSSAGSGFWMALNELSSPVPWLSKRVAHLRAIATSSGTFIPRRNPLSYLAAMFVPHLGAQPWSGFWRLLLVFLWIAVVLHAVVFGYQRLQRSGFIDRLALQFVTVQSKAPAAPASRAEPERPYARLDADLRQLGELARARRHAAGDIPCDIGSTAALKLNYSWQRYAYSCNESVVYTAVERGEFEPGRPAYVRKYDWDRRRIIAAPSGVKSK
jgi:Zn-dependent protease with chaperone function